MNAIKKPTSRILWYLSGKKRKLILRSLADYEADISRMKNQYITFSDRQHFLDKWGPYLEIIKAARIPKRIKSLEPIRALQKTNIDLDLIFTCMNNSFIMHEAQRCDSLLSNIDGKSLDYQQRTAVICNEDRNLVLAGAGTGKTLTISGKVKYLCSEKCVSPEDILLITYTNKAADEMTVRISEKLNIPVQANTFHKLGLDIIAKAKGKKPDVNDCLKDFLEDYFESSIVNDPKAIENLIKYFSYYINIPAEMRGNTSLEDTYRSEKSSDLETLKSKYSRGKYIEATIAEKKAATLTLKNEQVKSQAEVMIANFLFLNGIRYEYEQPYPIDTSDTIHRQYKPDFYLPDYEIFIEHFGVDRKNKAKWLNPAEEKEYKNGMEWKRGIHKRYHTKLLETYSYYYQEGCLLEKLSELLTENGVKFNEPDFKEIFDTVYARESSKYLSAFLQLCKAFITLFKSNGYTCNNLNGLSYHNPCNVNPFFTQRTKIFISVIKPIIQSYESYLGEKGTVDFPDMINMAANLVKNGYNVHKYKWIIIDEFQDISIARYKLIKAILDQTGAKLLCVGDDWQSIYRFSGSDVSLFTDFEKYFGKAEIMKIEKTYRNSQELIDVAGHFVTQNPAQLIKQLRSDKHLGSPIVFYTYKKDPSLVLTHIIDRIIMEYGENSSILLLGRTNYDIQIIQNSRNLRIGNDGHVVYLASAKTPIMFMTVHGSKGLEADNIILLNFQNATFGFPNKISDDPILELVTTKGETYPYAEERRLLYVALTRTKNQAFILINERNPSEFKNDFKEAKEIIFPILDSEEAGNKPFVDVPRQVAKEVDYEVNRISGEVIGQIKKRFIAVDFETTGLSWKNDRIIQIGAVIFENGKVVSQFETLVNPGFTISKAISEINHITNDMLRSAPNERTAISEFVHFLGEAIKGKYILCAHNAHFDAKFLTEALRRYGYDASLQFVDTYWDSRRTIFGLENYQLDTVAAYFGIVNNSSHNALSDAGVSGTILLRLLHFGLA